MKSEKTNDLLKIQNLVGDITESNLKYVDYYVSDNLGIFIPSVGFCEYAISPQHTHPAYSFILFLSQEQDIVSPTIEVLPEHYLMTAIAPQVPHEEEETDTFNRYIAILISKDFFDAHYSIFSPNSPKVYFWDQFQVEQEILYYLKKFMTEFENKLPGYNNVLEAISVIITHVLIRNILKINKKHHTMTGIFEIESVIEFMHQHFGEKLNIAAFSKLANMSQSHFIRIFKEETGASPMEYLISVRIGKAKKLLRSGAKNITEVASQCGFNSISHFSSSFSKHIGLTPSGYQKFYVEQQNR